MFKCKINISTVLYIFAFPSDLFYTKYTGGDENARYEIAKGDIEEFFNDGKTDRKTIVKTVIIICTDEPEAIENDPIEIPEDVSDKYYSDSEDTEQESENAKSVKLACARYEWWIKQNKFPMCVYTRKLAG